MPDHLKLATWLNGLRVVIGLALGTFLVWSVLGGDWPIGAADEGRALLVLAGLCILLATLRVFLVAGAFFAFRGTRRVGLAMAVFDCVNLLLFPLSTMLGLHGIVAWRHPETRHHFRSRRETVAA